jgi:hypothetical protein
MTASGRDERDGRNGVARRSRLQTRLIATWAAGGLLQAGAWACKERTETHVSPAIRAAETMTAGKAAANAGPRSDSAEAAGQRTTRAQMLSHYADTAAMRRALVAGKLADYQAAAAAVARDEWTPSAAAERREFTERARAAATAAQAAPSLVAAAQALGALGDGCASCHLASGVPELPIAPEVPIEASNPRMLAHAVASDRLWAGLTLPSDESWSSAIQLLLQDPALADPSDEVSAAARLLRELARRGERAEPDERGQLLADVLLTCSGCHERLGVVLEDGVVVR